MELYEPKLLPSYHLVVPEPSRYIYSIEVGEFRKHLELISQFGGQALDDCRLTFDDCHASQFRCGFPFLQHSGLRGRFFAIVGNIGRRLDFMTWQQLRELVAAGHDVQSHSLSHLPLTCCDRIQLSRELSSSRRELEQKLGVPIDAISVPFGRWNRKVIAACAEAGYRRVYTSDPVAALSISGVDVFGRFIVRKRTSLHQLKRVLSGNRQELRRLQGRHRCTLLFRASIGERAYFALWGKLRSRDHQLSSSRALGTQAG